MPVSRRHFLQTAGALTIGFAGMRRALAGDVREAKRVAGFGPLTSDAQGLLDLPEGFSYTLFSRAGEEMDDGFFVPHAHDGMAAFAAKDGRTILVRNHEMTPGEGGPFGSGNERLSQLQKDQAYDYGHGKTPGLGGTTTLIYDTKNQKLDEHYLSLAGTARNCAGGPTPWDSWLTCEETVERAGERCEKDHGYIFEVPAHHRGLAKPEALKAMGRFNHEAIAIDAKSGIVYQTEDRHDGLLYRFLPNKPGELAAGGKLQALVVKAQESLDTRNWGTFCTVNTGMPLAVEWRDLEDVESPGDELRFQGFIKGAARFARGEGMWTGQDGIYFACTSGGPKGKGQIWRYVPSAVEGQEAEGEQPGVLELFLEPNDSGLCENCDNLTVAPWGDLVICEDGGGDDYVIGVTPEGGVYQIAHNVKDDSEFAGATFSPDGSTLFVNVQGQGVTVAITGPWTTARMG